MDQEIAEQDLPGIGRRYDIQCDDGGQVSVVIHHSGRRDLYARGSGQADGPTSVTLNDDQARRLGAVLAGAYFKPAAVARIEAVIGDLLVDWITVSEESESVGRSIGELGIREQTRMTVAAIVRGTASILAPEPGERLEAGDQVVVIGPTDGLAAVQRLLGSSG